ncbi:MAG: cytochrome c maturation protein CcmE [Proteobacteria bacterium]|nr:cytochrome c maturation protein CcmE [Pseudomonadota bacterium]
MNTSLHTQRRKRSPRSRFSVILVIASMVVLVLMVYNIEGNSVYFYTPKEAYSQAQSLAGERIRVGGMIEVGSVKHQAGTLQVNFVLSDLATAQLNVTYFGALPDMFKEGQGVVVEGVIHPQTQSVNMPSMEAEKLMVKHSEEYSLPDHPHSINSELLQQSLLQDSKEASY